MKKITLMLFMSLMSFCAFAQLPLEGFEGTWPPTGWEIYNNGIGPAVTWAQSQAGNITQPPYAGTHAAYLNRENVATGIPEDWLVTPTFPVPANPQLRFFSRLTQALDDGSIYRVLITTNTANAGVFADYTLLEEWTELEINPVQTVYNEVVVPIPASFVGQNVRIAFVMAGDNGDRWLVDNVSVVSQCIDPSNLGANSFGLTTANLTWTNNSGATSWEIEILPAAAIPTEVGVVYNGAPPYPATVLTQDTDYKFYVRALCADGGTSEWVGPFFFSTVALGATCNAPIEIATLPYSTTNNTSNFGDDYSGSPGASGCGSTSAYLNGDDVVYSYTAPANGNISINVTNNGAYSGVFVYTSCANIGVNCAAGAVAGFTAVPLSIPTFAVTAGQTYYVVISTWATPQTTPYTLTIQQVNCAPPVGLTTTGIGQTSAQLSWTNPSGATSWQVVVQAPGAGIPAGAGTTASTNTNYLAGGLTPATPYEYYVRADCGNGTFSAWAGPYLFNTSICDVADQCNFTFVMTDTFGDGWNGNTMTISQNGIPVATIGSTFTTGVGPVSVTVPLCDGLPFQLYWNAGGSFAGEVGVSVVNSFNQTIYTKAPGTGVQNSLLYTTTVDCDTPACLPPTGLSVSQISTDQVDLEWDGPATGDWEYVVVPAGDPAPADSDTGIATTTNPATATGLTAATNYEFYVRINCVGGTTSTWAGPFAFTTAVCELANQCVYDFVMTDSFGDGWNGNTMTISQNGATVAVIGPSFTTGLGPVTVSVALCNNEPLELFWNAGGAFAGEVGVSIVNNFDQTIYTKAPGTGVQNSSLYTTTVDCNNPACLPPGSLTATNITTTEADLGWGGPATGNWEYVIVPQGDPAPTDTTPGVATTTNPAEVSGLTPSTAYSFYIRLICDGGTPSAWAGPYNFNTQCTAFDVPFYEGFNSDSDTEFCWTVNNQNGDNDTWNMNYQFNTFEGNQVAVINTDFNNGNNNDWLISPAINLTGNQRLKFHQRVQSSFEPNDFEVLVSTTGTNPADFTIPLIPLASYDNTGYVEYIVNLEDAGTLITGPVHIAWHVPNGGLDGWILYIDNVIVEDIPPCPEVTDLAVANITQTSAELSWEAGSDETQWEVWVLPIGSPEPTEPGTVVTENPYTATDLEPGTPYVFYVRANCGDVDGDSVISNPETFVTALVNDDCDGAVDVPVNPDAECDEFVSGSMTGATGSGVTQTCITWTDIEYDVWYSFVAEANTHSVTVNNITGGLFLQQILFEGDDCGNLTQLSCGDTSEVYTGLVPGNTYYVMVYTTFFNDPSAITSFDICVKTPVPPISVSADEYTMEELVQEVLIGSDCALVSNVTSSQGSDFGGEASIGYFDQNGSTFPFENGIVMATGGISEAPGPNPGNATFDPFGWPGDADLSAIIAEGGNTGALNNASVLEFDFVPFSDEISFDFLFASNEYGIFQCFFSDAFAFILTGPTTDANGDNLAVIPGTTIPVSVVNIRDTQYNTGCASANVEYFGQYNPNNPEASAIGYNGQTIVMQASASVIAGETYHIKLVIADYSDAAVNSAVFLGGGSFNIGEPEFGSNLTISDGNAVCAGGQVLLDTEMDPDTYDFIWYQNEEVIDGETGPSYEVTEAGTYKVEVYYENTDCFVDEEIVVEFYDPIEDITGVPDDLTACDATGFATFDLTENDAAVLEGLENPDDYAVTYHATAEDAENGVSPIGPEYTNTTQFQQTVYIRIENTVSDCYGVKEFDLIIQDLTPEFDITEDFTICDGGTGTITVTPTNFDGTQVTYTWTLDGDPIAANTATISVTEAGIYEVTIDNTGCEATGSVTVTVAPTPVPDAPADVTVCDSYTLPALTVGNYYTATGGQGDMLAAGDVITATQTLYVYAVSDTNPDCTAENSFVVTINNTPVLDVPADVASCDSYVLPALATGNYYTGPGATGTMLNADDVITTSQTIYVYASTGTTPDCSAEGSFVVTITDSPVAQVMADVTACDSYTLPALNPGNAYYTGTGGTGDMLAAGEAITATQTIYIFAETGTTPNCTDESSFVVTINPTPQFSLGGPYSACLAETVSISVTGANFNTANATYVWTYEGTTLADNDASITPANGAFGTYEVTVTVNGCTATQSVTVSENTANIALMYEEGCEDGDYLVTVMPFNDPDTGDSFNPDTASYAWSGPNGFSGSTQQVTIPAAGIYTVTVTTADGCVGEVDINVLDTSCSIQRGISPNGDGMNDSFDLTSLGVSKISIFNRYGKEVFSYGAYTNQWHGQGSNGDELPTGTYFYSIQRSNGESKTGWVYINRQQ